MFVHSMPHLNLTLFYFDENSAYSDLARIVRDYIATGPTLNELFFFASDAPLITPMQVKSLLPIAAKSAKVRPPGGKTALLYGRLALYGLGRIYRVVENTMVEKTWESELFKELDCACAWLDISIEEIQSAIVQYILSGNGSNIPVSRYKQG